MVGGGQLAGEGTRWRGAGRGEKGSRLHFGVFDNLTERL